MTSVNMPALQPLPAPAAAEVPIAASIVSFLQEPVNVVMFPFAPSPAPVQKRSSPDQADG